MTVLALIIAGIGSLTSCRPENAARTPLRIYHAGSLIVPFQAMEKQFELQNPTIDVLLEGHGSIQVIRAVTELGKEVDIAAVADNQLLPLLMYSVDLPDGSGPYAYWHINFATNSVGIAYRESSRYASEITADNWFEILSRQDVRFGTADPRIDALGYRALMVAQLAENHYEDAMLFERLFGNSFTAGIEVEAEKGTVVIRVPQILQPSQNRVVLRSYSIQILALLESGDVDYAFEYESVASQRGLRFLNLPDAVNLSSQDYADTYGRIRARIDFQRFSSVIPDFKGTPVVYGITIPGNALHRQEAITFLEYLLGEEGRRILKENYQPPLVPPYADYATRVPADLRSLVK